MKKVEYGDRSLPPALLEQLQRSRVVPFVGAGLSVAAGLPSWEQLLRDLLASAAQRDLPRSAATQIEQAIASEQFELAADALVNELGDHFADTLRTVLRRADIKPNATHRLIATVEWPAIITTNYDDLLPGALSAHLRRLTWRDDADLGTVLRRAEPHLLFAHGCLDKAESIVLTAAHYRECLRHAPYRTYLKIMCTQYTLLFLGFSFTDRDVEWLLEDLRHEFGKADVPHFALMSTEEVGTLRAQNLRSNFNIHVLPYSVENRQHSAVERLIRSIVDCCPAEQIIDKTAGLRDLSTLKSRKNALGAEEYLEQFKDTCTGLARLGYVRTSWAALQGALNDVKNEISIASRVRQTLALANLMIVDGQYRSAGQQLQGLYELPLKQQLPEFLVGEFCQLWFDLGIANYQLEILREARALAHEANCSADIVAAMDTRLELYGFLNGESSILPRDERGHDR